MFQVGQPIPWVRIGVAALLSEVIVVVALGVSIVVYRFLIVPGKSLEQYHELGERVGYYVGPPAALVAVFVCALWAIRNLSSGFFLNGFLVGLGAVILTVGFLFGAKPEHRLMYGTSFVLRLIGGILAGAVAPRL
jgi:hypothetical protein